MDWLVRVRIIGGMVGSRLVVVYVGEVGRANMLYLCLIPLLVMIVIGIWLTI